jgi:hypothetical protein
VTAAQAWRFSRLRPPPPVSNFFLPATASNIRITDWRARRAITAVVGASVGVDPAAAAETEAEADADEESEESNPTQPALTRS